MFFFFFKQKTAYEITVRDWSAGVCSSDLSRAEPCASRFKMPDEPLAAGEVLAPRVEGVVVGLGGCLELVERRPRGPPVDRNEPPRDADVARQRRVDIPRTAPKQLGPLAFRPVGADEVLLRACLRLEHPHHHEHNLPLRAHGRLDAMPREEFLARPSHVL